ncbi:MAG: hypothetical protein LBI71_10280 [Enterobacteriaceae bacterium]|nr:hypothetical protein [Enterobacteriaceae bacterium]
MQQKVLLLKNDTISKVVVDKAITEIKANGAYQRIWDRYFGHVSVSSDPMDVELQRNQ